MRGAGFPLPRSCMPHPPSVDRPRSGQRRPRSAAREADSFVFLRWGDGVKPAGDAGEPRSDQQCSATETFVPEDITWGGSRDRRSPCGAPVLQPGSLQYHGFPSGERLCGPFRCEAENASALIYQVLCSSFHFLPPFADAKKRRGLLHPGVSVFYTLSSTATARSSSLG